MLFTSASFFVLLVITMVIYYNLKSQIAQVATLLIASFVFYAWHYPILLLLLVISILINVVVSYKILKTIDLSDRKLFAIIGVVLNLAILAFFKYSPLVGATFFPETSGVGEFLVGIPLPIGISFFTFQGISLVVDTFKNDKIEEYNTITTTSFADHVVNTSFFISFFPQLVAGPIVKAHEFLPQITTKFFGDIQREQAFKDIVTGYFLKMVIADNLKGQTFGMLYPYFETKSSITLFAMLFGYSMQIFADFAGYSLIAIGIARLFGYNLKDNFMFPYISTSFSEFWRRWHISLSSFLKEYLYIPLGGNQKGKARTYFNLMTTMVLGGFWHGAAWSYAVWGVYHGMALALERLIKDQYKFRFKGIGLVLKGIFVFSTVTFGWLLFKLPDFSHVIIYVKCMLTNLTLPKGSEMAKMFLILLYALPIIIYHFSYLFKEKGFQFNLKRVESFSYGAMLFMILMNSGPAGDFIYFQF